MNTSDLNWHKWLENGDQYLKGATPKTGKSRFGTSIQYNLLSMSFESYAMAMLDFHQSLPDNHTYTDLIMALEQVLPLDEGLKNRILKYESVQSICSVDKYLRKDPTEEELADLHGAIVEISKMAHTVCDDSATN